MALSYPVGFMIPNCFEVEAFILKRCRCRDTFEVFFSSVVVVVSGSRVFAVASSRLLNFQSLISNFDERGR